MLILHLKGSQRDEDEKIRGLCRSPDMQNCKVLVEKKCEKSKKVVKLSYFILIKRLFDFLLNIFVHKKFSFRFAKKNVKNYFTQKNRNKLNAEKNMKQVQEIKLIIA